MEPSPSILSTHSGHHRIFIGPVVQKNQQYQQSNNIHASGNGPTVSPSPLQGRAPDSALSQSATPKPWWDQVSFLKSHLSLNPTSQPVTLRASRDVASGNLTNGNVASATAPEAANIPKLSVMLSDDSDDSSNNKRDNSTEDETSDMHDSEDESEDHDDDDDDDDSDGNNKNKHNRPEFSSSSESVSARVGHSLQDRSEPEMSSSSGGEDEGESEGLPRQHSLQQRQQQEGSRDKHGRGRRGLKGKGKARVDETPDVSRRDMPEKKRTKSMRDEGEPNRIKKFFGHFREGRHNQGLHGSPDLGWESDGSRRPRITRQMTSGALISGHQQHAHAGHHPVLEASPLSSEVDLPGTINNNNNNNVSSYIIGGDRAVFVSSPVSSLLDVSIVDDDQLKRPDPSPIQDLLSRHQDAAGGTSDRSDRLHPGVWKPSSSANSSSSSSSPIDRKLHRGATWVTARDTTSSIGRDSLYDHPIQEDDEDDDDSEEHFSIARVTSRESERGVEGQDNKDIKDKETSASSSRSETSMERAVKGLSVSDDALAPKEPLSTTTRKAGTRIGRALLKTAPTGLKPQQNAMYPSSSRGSPLQKQKPGDEEKKRGSFCSVDKECQKLVEDAPTKKRHVQFLTKVQYQIAPGKQPSSSSKNPVVKQDRMLVRKEVTERPGPHVFNSETARRLERQSQGWREWWCVMRGRPVASITPVTKIRKKSKAKKRVEKGRLEFYYNHKKIQGTVVLSSCTSVSVYSSLDYSIAVTQNYPEALGLTIYILRPQTIALACAWYMEIYALLHGSAPIPSCIEIAVPDFDVKVKVPIPEDSDTESDDDDCDRGTALSRSLPQRGPVVSNPVQRFKTAAMTLPQRMASKTFFMTNDDARPTVVAPDEVTPRLLRSHVLSLLKDVPDWTEVVKLWQDPKQHGDVALCWKRYDRIEWIYWGERVPAETDDLHLRKDHIGFADGSDWIGGMDETVVGPQVLDKTHVLELRPITHYPTKAKGPGGVELHEPDPIEGYLVRVSTFAGNPIRRFRRLYLTSHDHLLIYTIPSQSHSPTMQHASSIDPSALLFCITPHRSANPDHKDMAQSRSVRRLKAQVRAARGLIDMTKIESVRVLTVREWDVVRHLPYKTKEKPAKESRRERLGKATRRTAEGVEEMKNRNNGANGPDGRQRQPEIITGEPDNYFFSFVQEDGQRQGVAETDRYCRGLDNSEPLCNSLGKNTAVAGQSGASTFKDGLIKSATFVTDLLLKNDAGDMDDHLKDSNVIEIQMKDGPCVRFRAYSAEAAHLWRDQLEKLTEYWTLRKHLDVKDHMNVAHSNYQLASSLDADEIQVGETIHDWDNDRALASPDIWNWCVVNGCRSITKSGMVYFKPKRNSTFRKMFLVLTEGYLMLFHPHRRSKASGQVIPTATSKLYAIHSLMDIYIYSGHFSDEDTSHGTNDESERLPRFFPDGLIVDDPDEDCTFSIWRGKRRKMFSRRGAALMTMSSRAVGGSSRIFGKNGLLSSVVKDGVVYGSTPQSCSVFRARSRPDLEEWVYAINTEIERGVRSERRRVRSMRRP